MNTNVKNLKTSDLIEIVNALIAKTAVAYRVFSKVCVDADANKCDLQAALNPEIAMDMDTCKAELMGFPVVLQQYMVEIALRATNNEEAKSLYVSLPHYIAVFARRTDAVNVEGFDMNASLGAIGWAESTPATPAASATSVEGGTIGA